MTGYIDAPVTVSTGAWEVPVSVHPMYRYRGMGGTGRRSDRVHGCTTMKNSTKKGRKRRSPLRGLPRWRGAPFSEELRAAEQRKRSA